MYGPGLEASIDMFKVIGVMGPRNVPSNNPIIRSAIQFAARILRLRILSENTPTTHPPVGHEKQRGF